MALFPISGSPIRGRFLAYFPAHAEGDGGISVSKSNGVWTIEPDWTALSLITSGSIVDSFQTWVYNPSTETYYRAALSSIVNALGQTGGGISLSFTADLTATTEADPGAGKIRFNQSDQNTATELYVDDADSNGMTITGSMGQISSSGGSTVLGHLSLTKSGDADKRLNFAVTALSDESGYTKLTVTNTDSSATSPFVEGDTLVFAFAPAGADGSSSGDVTAASNFGTDNVLIRSDSTSKGVQHTGILVADTTDAVSGIGTITPKASNTQQLGSTTLMWADIFLGSGAVVNFDNGDVTLTHSSGALAFAGGTYSFDAAPTVSSNELLHNGGGNQLAGGFSATSDDAGTKSSGTFTPDPADGNFQHAVNGGAHTLAPPTNPCTIILEYLNNGSAGAVTTSSFTKVSGDTLTTTNGDKFALHILKTQNYSRLFVEALQ